MEAEQTGLPGAPDPAHPPAPCPPRTPANTRLSGVPATEGRLLLQRGDRLRVVAQPTADMAATTDAPPNAVTNVPREATPDTAHAAPLPTVPCTLPEVFSQVQAGERIWFDDGRIGGVVKTVSPDGWVVESPRPATVASGSRQDKGINLPDSLLDLPALTPKDVDDRGLLKAAGRHGGPACSCNAPRMWKNCATALAALGAAPGDCAENRNPARL